MASYHQQMQRWVFKRYQQEVSRRIPVDLREVGAWAMANRLWAPRPIDMQSRFAAEMAEALREEYRTGQEGFRRLIVRKVAVTESKDGRQRALLGRHRYCPGDCVVKNVGQRRRQSAYDLFLRIQMDVDHYNDAHPEEENIFKFSPWSSRKTWREMKICGSWYRRCGLSFFSNVQRRQSERFRIVVLT